MKAIVNVAPGVVEWREVPRPDPGPGEVRVRTAACGVCATDLEMIAGWARTGYPSIPGHEWSGVVDAAGEGADVSLVGRLCVAENVLGDGGEVGFEHAGGYGEYLVTEAGNVRTLPEGFPPATAALVEPLAVCVRALARLRLEDRTSALVFGDGPVGLIMAMLLRERGVRDVRLVGGRGSRLTLARELGATATFNYHEAGDDLAGDIRAGLGGGFPNIIEASGSRAAIDAAVELARHGAKVLAVGDYGDARAGFRWNALLHGEIEIIGSNASAGAWDEAVRLATSGELPLGKLVSHRRPASDFAEALDLARTARDVVKVVMEWGES